MTNFKSAFALFALLAGISLQAQASTVTFVVSLSGAQEVGSSGDVDGYGVALLAVDDAALTISWNLFLKNVDPTLATRLHIGGAGTNGPVRVDFGNQLTGTGLIDADLAGVLADPTNWYVNVQNATYPAGAIRGQLGSAATGPITSFVVPLEGNQVTVPFPRDADGSGVALLAIDPADSTIAWLVAVNDLDLPILSTQIHDAPPGVSGPLLVNFFGQLIGSVADPDLAQVLANPQGTYLDVHNAVYPGGAIRGQLALAGSPISEPDTFLLIALVALVAPARRIGRRCVSSFNRTLRAMLEPLAAQTKSPGLLAEPGPVDQAAIAMIRG